MLAQLFSMQLPPDWTRRLCRPPERLGQRPARRSLKRLLATSRILCALNLVPRYMSARGQTLPQVDEAATWSEWREQPTNVQVISPRPEPGRNRCGGSRARIAL